MKIKIPGVLWLGMSAILILLTGSIYVSSHKNNIKVEDTFIVGSEEMADELSDRIKIKVRYLENNYFYCDVIYDMVDERKASSTFYPNNYNVNKFYNSNNISLFVEPFDFTSVINEMSKNMEKERTIRVADYYTYIPLKLQISLNGIHSRSLRGDDFVQIKVPEELVSNIKLDDNMGMSMDSIILTFLSFETPLVELEDAYYFTISNKNEMEAEYVMERAVNPDQVYDSGNIPEEKNQEMTKPILYEYTSKSGIYKVNKHKQITKIEDLEWIYPVELSNGKDNYVMGLDYIEETNQLMLFTAEEGKIYVTFLNELDYRVDGKYEIDSYQDRGQLVNYDIRVKNNQIMLMYYAGGWIEGGVVEPQNNMIRIYECKKGVSEEIEIQELFHRQWSSIGEYTVIPQLYDYYLEDDILYLLSANFVLGGYLNGAQMIAMDQNEIRFIRSFSDHWKEDLNYMITGNRNLAGGTSCYVNDMMFLID